MRSPRESLDLPKPMQSDSLMSTASTFNFDPIYLIVIQNCYVCVGGGGGGGGG